MEPLVVTRESIEAYERRTGFSGIGEFFLKKGLFVLQEESQCENGAGSPRITSSSTTTFLKEPKVVSFGNRKNILVSARSGISGRSPICYERGAYHSDR